MRRAALAEVPSLFCHPQLEGPVVGAGGNQLPVQGNVQTHDFALVSGQGLQGVPARVGPHLGRVVVGPGQQEVAVIRWKERRKHKEK